MGEKPILITRVVEFFLSERTSMINWAKMGSLSLKEQKGHKIMVFAPLCILTKKGQIQWGKYKQKDKKQSKLFFYCYQYNDPTAVLSNHYMLQAKNPVLLLQPDSSVCPNLLHGSPGLHPPTRLRRKTHSR